MRTILILAFTILFTVYGKSQKGNDPIVPYSYCNWENVCLNKDYTPDKYDSCLFVVSTRNYNTTKHEFVDYDYDTTSTLKYFAVYFNGNNWTAIPYPSLEELLNQKKDFNDVVIFTEGLGKTFTSGIDRATKLMRLYPVNGIFFDWPTERPYMKPGKNIKTTCTVAPMVAVAYSNFLEEFQSYKISYPQKFNTVTLFFHSMGNMILMYGLKNDLYKNISANLADNVVLNAACVNQNNHKQWIDKLNFSKHVYVTINNKDRNLRGARIIFAAHQLGERVKPGYSEKVKYVDFSEVLNKEHNYFLIGSLLKKKPYIKQFYADVFIGKNPQLKFHNPEISEEVRKYLPEKDDFGVFTGIIIN